MDVRGPDGPSLENPGRKTVFRSHYKKLKNEHLEISGEISDLEIGLGTLHNTLGFHCLAMCPSGTHSPTNAIHR